MIINGVSIADVHVGALPAKVLRKELWTNFFPHVLAMKKIDIITVNGDLLDHKLSFNGEDSKLSLDIINTLIKIKISVMWINET